MNQNILIVDDEPSARRTVRAFLFKQNYTLHFAARGPQALAMLQDVTPDVILLDVMMPGMDGFEVCQKIKSVEQLRHIPIILVTALDGKADIVRGLEAGADDFLSKPLDKSELRARIRSMLRLKSQYDQLVRQQQRLTEALELNQRSAQVIAQHLETLELLHDLGLRLIQDLTTDSVLNQIAQTALEIIPEASGCVMHFAPQDENALLPVIFSGESRTKLVQTTVGFEEIVRQTINAGHPLTIGDVPHILFRDEAEYNTAIRSLLIAPLAQNLASLGAVTLCSSSANVFTEGDAYFMSILSNQAAVALDRARFLEEQARRSGQEKHLIKDMFQRYVSPPMVDRLVKGQEKLALGGRKQEVTVLFADIRGFTAFSETLEPERLVEILNHYLAQAVEAIVEQGGTLDKFIGDAVMAIFNAPVTHSDHTLRAVRAALTMQQAIANYNLQNPSHPQLSFGIGIHTGQAVVGNVGTTQRMNYTAIGDMVNLTWRLQENAGKGEIILSQASYSAVEERALVENLGVISLKGRRATEAIYALTGLVENDCILPTPIIKELEILK